uniref:Helix-turn-helix domain-containing protein n=2 Tax=root TaxID=1 RepID=S6CVQ9_COTCN|nr:hypothetical protein Penelope-like1 [Cotesia congregata]CDH92814.1 hypothetical protein Penelope-like1 [Bracoviriform congregatae]
MGMGNPASPSIANLVMQHVLKNVVKDLPFAVPLLGLYVDDTILAVPVSEKNNLLGYFNSYHRDIQFTLEVEEGGRIAFLDVLVIRQPDGSLITDWYQKPTSAGRMLNYNSHHPVAQKSSVVFGLLHRALGLSHKKFHDVNRKRVEDLLKRNNYPVFFIKLCMEKFNSLYSREMGNGEDDNLEVVVDLDQNVKKNENRFRFPYIRGLSSSITHCFAGTDWKPAFYNIKTVGQTYTRLKDTDKLLNRSNVIYKIPCVCNKSYIGQTKQYLGKRLYQHKYSCRNNVNNNNSNNNINNLTALSLHHRDTSHQFCFDDVKIVDIEKNRFKRNILEMIHISLRDTVNLKTDTEGLNCIYNNLILRYKNKNREYE